MFGSKNLFAITPVDAGIAPHESAVAFTRVTEGNTQRLRGKSEPSSRKRRRFGASSGVIMSRRMASKTVMMKRGQRMGAPSRRCGIVDEQRVHSAPGQRGRTRGGDVTRRFLARSQARGH